MKVLVLNCGSSSVKYQLFEMDDESVIAKGIVEEIGSDRAIFKYKSFTVKPQDIKRIEPIKDHEAALGMVLNTLMDPEIGVVKDRSEIAAVGHRVVHGGESFSGSVLIDSEVIKKMNECTKFAPLHNPPNLKGIEAGMAQLPGVPQFGSFDTAFHQSMPPKAYLYGIPYEDYKEYGIRRYGFHGTSHYFVSHRAAEILGKPIEELKIVTCHLGNGASIAAVKNGVSIDTSMGFTPLEGLLMGTRSGDMDPYIPLYVMEQKGLSISETSNYLNKKSGLKGLTGKSSDMREVESAWQQKSDERSVLAFEMFAYRIRKYIGAYLFAMGGVDAIVFTGGIGEHSPDTRILALQDLESFGISIDREANDKNAQEIGTGSVRVLVVPTDEELVIARECVSLLNR